MSEVRGSGQECQASMAQERPRGATLHPRSRGRPRGATTRQGLQREELPRVQGQGPRSGGDTPCLKPRARGHGQEELPHAPKPEAKGSGGEEQPLD